MSRTTTWGPKAVPRPQFVARAFRVLNVDLWVYEAVYKLLVGSTCGLGIYCTHVCWGLWVVCKVFMDSCAGFAGCAWEVLTILQDCIRISVG